MPGVTQLSLYNKALRHLGERRLASLSEDREPRRLLDDEYSDALNYCLGQGFWNFAMRTISIDYDTGIEPPFGLQYAFAKPSDWLRTYQIASDEMFSCPLTHWTDESQYWYANVQTMYVGYISNGDTYGLDLSQWPDTFVEYVAIYLARKIAPSLTSISEDKLEALEKREKRYRIDARAKDAMNEPVKYPPTGTWVRSRNYGSANRSSWGSR